MLVLLAAMVLFFWMVVGAVQYVVCVAIAPLRRFALSAALWWVVWGPCSVGLLLAGLVAMAAQTVKAPHGVSEFVARIVQRLGWSYVAAGVLGTVATATVVAWMHQAVVRRFPFALFRIYACLVSAGVGSVFGWCLDWWLLGTEVRLAGALGLLGMVGLVVVFGWGAYVGAGKLRGARAEVLPWVTREEFEAG